MNIDVWGEDEMRYMLYGFLVVFGLSIVTLVAVWQWLSKTDHIKEERKVQGY